MDLPSLAPAGRVEIPNSAASWPAGATPKEVAWRASAGWSSPGQESAVKEAAGLAARHPPPEALLYSKEAASVPIKMGEKLTARSQTQ